MPVKVVDASVLAALAFGEPRADEAASLLSGADLYAPNLLPYEMASVAIKKIERYPAQAFRLQARSKRCSVWTSA